MRDYKKYNIWKEGHLLVLEIYGVTKKFPKEELFGLVSQLRRAMVSVPTNIAEGSGRGSDKDFNKFLIIAHASATEVEYLIYLSNKLKYISDNDFKTLNERIILLRKQIHQLIKKLKPIAKS